MKIRSGSTAAKRYLCAGALALFLAGCGGGGGGGGATVDTGGGATGGNSGSLTSSHEISGSVGDGPIIDADVEIFAADGTSLGTVTSDSSARFSVTVTTTSTDYPLTVVAQQGTDIVTGLPPDFELASAVTRSGEASTANLNPFTTIAIGIAEDLSGGLTDANVRAATETVVSALNSGLGSLANIGVMSTPLTSDNIAEMVKASETLGETIRRSRDALRAVGRSVDGDRVVASLSADLADGAIDGRGGAGADARIAAVANISMAQTALEAMADRLRVNGADARALMDDAIAAVMPEANGVSTSDVPVTARMLQQVRRGLAAAQALAPDPTLVALDAVVDSIPAGSMPSDIAGLYSSSATAVLDNVLIASADASSADIEKINTAARNGTPPAEENSPPTISGSPGGSVTVGNSYGFTPEANDPDGDTLTFDVENLPAWAAFSASTGALTGTPDDNDVGIYGDIVISVSDGAATAALAPFSIEVRAASTPNSAPTISGDPATTVTVGNRYRFTPQSNDPDGDALSFDIDNRPAWASFNTSTGALTGSPGDGDIGNWGNIVITVSDGAAAATLGPFSIEVVAAPVSNSPPTISGSPAPSVTAGNTYRFTPQASDPDGDALTFDIDNLPAWARFETGTGRLRGTPDDSDVGTYDDIVITVTDGEETASLGPFSIEVVPAPVSNTPPTISGSPAGSVTAGNNYSFTPQASDPDGDALTFDIDNRPAWASFSTSTGALTGTPGDGDVGSYGNIVITVSDGAAAATLGPFSIEVVAAPVSNSPPTISGSPASSVTAGKSYSFTPQASDPDGDTLTFDIENLPAWASFNTSTGALTGTPGDGNVGTYGNIRISVSDGQESVSLPAFSITVEAVSLGSVTLSWTPPTQNTDGSTLTDLAGYRIYWGTTPGSYPNSVTIDNPGISSYVLENLAPGTYEFVATSYNAEGVESDYSNTATKTVTAP